MERLAIFAALSPLPPPLFRFFFFVFPVANIAVKDGTVETLVFAYVFIRRFWKIYVERKRNARYRRERYRYGIDIRPG